MENRIKELRKKKGITQKELAQIIGITQAALSNYERGRAPSYDIAHKIANYFGKSIAYVLGYVDESYSDPRNDDFLEAGKITSNLGNIELFDKLIATWSDWDDKNFNEKIPKSTKELIGENIQTFLNSYSSIVYFYEAKDTPLKDTGDYEKLLKLEGALLNAFNNYHHKVNNDMLENEKIKLKITLQGLLAALINTLNKESGLF
ncbi:helix-turn-helix domain-containing protein [Ligilactobacillus equi]|uniref:HTH cro/C1-type domain-containing protein n=1 Tax=Ligilactobacillus equi DSM 15833 = JCM 10991 TaxID=1423740 RepID=A0A0R1TEG1_9LACO|nr:helix-turn-helix transcriptional regulator [Ligilactobacillus equi]KRL79510.1 hypothetical protein FC36_GL000458 [Ligilactobacillus equi DSM 15833 = JCM 10991]